MASTFKTFTSNDIASTRTLLHESIPLTGAICSGTYGTEAAGTFPNCENIKNFAHGQFQAVYDYPYLSSSANHVYDLTVGFSNDSEYSGATPNVHQEKKINMYNTMAQILMGYDHTGSIQKFDQDGNILAGGTKHDSCFFLNFSRLLYKDEIKKGSFSMTLGIGETWAKANNTRLVITDAGAQSDYRVNSPAGEYGILSASSGQTAGSLNGLAGLIFYQAGIAVVTGSVFGVQPGGMAAADCIMYEPPNDGQTNPTQGHWSDQMTGSEISGTCDNIRHRLYDVSFNNTTELNSSIYFCRAHHNDFNYSANPTYLTGSKIRVKNNTLDEPVSYITTVGLYSADNELLAVAKVSEPLKKTPSNELTLRVRLDY